MVPLLESIRLRGDQNFRWRGREVSRVEAFSDAVFAFAITLLVVSLDVPSTFDDLMATMRGFVAFGLCFALLVHLWYNHFLFFRRYALQDPATITLNAVLLFLVLFYTYPLKFLYVFLTGMFGVDSAASSVIEPSQVGTLVLVYSVGYLAIFLLYALLFRRGLRYADILGLDALERHETTTTIRIHLVEAGVAALSIVIVLAGGHPAAAGMIYFLIGPGAALVSWRRERPVAGLRVRREAESGVSDESSPGRSVETPEPLR